MAISDFLTFALDQASNIMLQPDWEVTPARQRGFSRGLAKSAEVNKAIRQAAFMSATLAQFVVNMTGEDQLDDGDLAAAVERLHRAVGRAIRIKLTAPLDLYVAIGGSDTAAGTSSILPLATMQGAWNLLGNVYDLGGYMVTVHVAPGTYNTPLSCTGMLPGSATGGGGSVLFIGDLDDPSNVIVNVAGNAISTLSTARIAIQGMELRAANGTCLYADYNSEITFGDIHFGAANYHMVAQNSSNIINVGRPYAIVGDALTAHMEAFSGSSITTINMTCTIAGVCHTVNFATAYSSGHIFAIGAAYLNPSNLVIGGRYSADMNGTIDTASGNPAFFPGTVAGAVSRGGQYA